MPIVDIEVTVPRILLPPAHTSDNVETDSQERIELAPLSNSSTTSHTSPSIQPITVSDFSTRTAHALLFHIFHLKAVAVHGQPLLLRVLRLLRRSAPVTDFQPVANMTLSITFRRGTVATDTGYQPQQASLHNIVIYLDEDGIPNDYRIDGAER